MAFLDGLSPIDALLGTVVRPGTYDNLIDSNYPPVEGEPGTDDDQADG
jgi:hypothetical protein